MSPPNDKQKPKYVRPPEKYPQVRPYLDWNDPKLKEWVDGAIMMQDAHFKDNNWSEWFVYTPEERDAIELRILMAIYGVRIPQKDGKNSPSSFFEGYSRDERLHARKIKKLIVKNSGSPEKIHFNIIYIATAAKVEGKDDYFASEEPVFVVKNGRKYVDKDCEVYGNFEEYKQSNNLPKGAMLYPKNGNYIVEVSDNKVPLELGETPSASPLKRIKAISDKIVMASGIVFGVAGVVTCLNPAAFSATVMAVIQAGSFALTTYSLVGAAYNIYDKTSRDESIRTEVLLLISSALSSYTGALRMKVGQYARQGKTYTEVVNKINQFQRNIFAAVNVLTFVSSTITVLSSFYDLWKKKERTWLDYYQLCMGLFMATNVLTKPITIQGVFESEQLRYLGDIEKSLGSSDAKEEMSKMLKEHSTSDQKAYFIRNFNRIENPTEFFELVKKTGSVVKCTADGLKINEKIDISPESYNDIGKAVFDDKFAQIAEYRKAGLHKSLLKEFGKHLPTDVKEEFEKKLDKITKLPADQRKEAMRGLIEEYKDRANPSGQAFRSPEAFDRSWNTAEEACKKDVNTQLNKLITNLKQGSNEAEQQEDFNKLKTLATKQLDGTITSAEEKELQQQIDKCARHRKEYFFQSSANHRNDANYDETMNNLEKQLAGGKNLEEWKMTQRELEDAHRNNRISEAEYQQQRAEVDNGIEKAKHVRDFRSKADGFLNSESDSPNGNDLKQKFIDKCQADLETAMATGNADEIAAANDKLETARRINADLNENVLDANKSFNSDRDTFTNAKNERLCYRIDVEQVKRDLQHFYERPNIEDITINEEKPFANMKIGDYDRLKRVLDIYGSDGKKLMVAATTIANDNGFVGNLKTVHDIASITEAIHTQMGELDASDRPAFLESLASGAGDHYVNFRNRFNEIINDVNNLDPSIRSQWTSPLSMAYHWWKHKGDFGDQPETTMDKYFREYANNLFQTKNRTVIAHGQSGGLRATYMQCFGGRIHVGFTAGQDQKVLSHFPKARVI